MTPAMFKNKAHQTAFANGKKTALAGEDRSAPYGCENRSTMDFRRAWLAGYDAGALEACADAMRRADPALLGEGEHQVTDAEWDIALAAVTQAVGRVPACVGEAK